MLNYFDNSKKKFVHNRRVKTFEILTVRKTLYHNISS